MRRSSKTHHSVIRDLVNRGPTSLLSDAELLDQFRSDSDDASENAFESLLRRHGSMVLSVCRKVVGNHNDAEDAFQATFFILAKRALSIRKQRSVACWLHGVAYRVASRLRAETERRRAGERRIAEAKNREVDRGIAFVDDDSHDDEALHQEIQGLPAIYREVIVLCYLQGMTQEAAAMLLHCPSSTVGVRLMRARTQLKDRLTRRGISMAGGELLASVLAWDSSPEMSKHLRATTMSVVMRMGAKLSPAAARVAAEILRHSVAVKRTSLAATALVAALCTASFGGVVTGVAVLAVKKPWERRSDSSVVVATVAAPRDERVTTDGDDSWFSNPEERSWSNAGSRGEAPSAVPEPSTLVIAVTASMILGGYAYLRRGKSSPSGTTPSDGQT
jgi:RNA polymerase sigma factor (sigma-70 family)